MAEPHASVTGNPYHYSFKVCSGTNNLAKQYSDSIYSSYLNTATSTEFHCDQCDRSFKSDSQLQSHINEHVVCNTNGCKFTAHPKIISAHIRMQHQSGIFNKIKKLDNPEEVKKWLAERKRKYPTQDNIEKQAKLENAKMQRGEVIENNKSRFNKNFTARGSNRRRKPRNKKPYIEKTANTKENSACHKESLKRNGDLPEFSGTGCIYEEPEETECSLNFHISDEDVCGGERCSASDVQPMNKSLALLMASYDSEEEIADNTTVTNPITNTSKEISEPVAESDVEPPDEVTNIVRGAEEVHNDSYKRSMNNSKRTNLKIRPRHVINVRKRKPTLLQKLLEDQVVNERKVIMESIHFIVQNNYFLDKVDDITVDKIVTVNHNVRPKSVPTVTASKHQEASSFIAKKPKLLKGLLQNEIIKEQNITLQCIRHIVKNNFMTPK